ncbi:hypothetical protein CMO96_03615 [Candidatus Woesebacteria bacterium]|nr:hypothetical protein [Candidatus Woesebacteria bacterium]|tara:strand:+ start:823 stop:1197 length:375 start_codon:yes stop_codon:yes gene_type:complete
MAVERGHQAPQGTFTTLTGLEDGSIGDAHTEHFIRRLGKSDICNCPDLRDNPLLTKEMVVFELRRRSSGNHTEKSHFFGIKPDDTITPLVSWQTRDLQDRRGLVPLTPDVLLREIQITQKLNLL